MPLKRIERRTVLENPIFLDSDGLECLATKGDERFGFTGLGNLLPKELTRPEGGKAPKGTLEIFVTFTLKGD